MVPGACPRAPGANPQEVTLNTDDWNAITKALDPYGIDGQQTTATKVGPGELSARLDMLGYEIRKRPRIWTRIATRALIWLAEQLEGKR